MIEAVLLADFQTFIPIDFDEVKIVLGNGKIENTIRVKKRFDNYPIILYSFNGGFFRSCLS